MCIIIVNPKGTLKRDILINSSENNPDGAGLMYANNGKLITFKNINNDVVIDEYYKIREYYKGVICLHFRIATDGEINTSTCHPYKVNKDVALMHNGILYQYSGLKTALSDTQLFITDVLTNFKSNVIFTPYFKQLLSMAIGSGNKFAIMNNLGQVEIINANQGVTDKQGNWYSNTTYKSYNYYPQKFSSQKQFTYSKKGIKAKKNKEYYDIDKMKYCFICGTPLYGLNEHDAGMCNYCQYDEHYRIQHTKNAKNTEPTKYVEQSGYDEKYMCCLECSTIDCYNCNKKDKELPIINKHYDV